MACHCCTQCILGNISDLYWVVRITVKLQLAEYTDLFCTKFDRTGGGRGVNTSAKIIKWLM